MHPATPVETPLAACFRLTDELVLRNRLVATAHGRAAVIDGVPTKDDADYWRRVAEGGVAMCIAGGTVVAPESTPRTRLLTEAWRPEAVHGLAMRAEAMHAGGALAVLQLLHLGRETLGANIYYSPVAPSAVRSPREPTPPRALTEAEVDELVEGFGRSAGHAFEAGFDGIELHAAHGYLLAQFLSPAVNRRPEGGHVAGRVEVVAGIAAAVREAAPGKAVGIRLSVGDPDDAGLSLEQLGELLPLLDPLFDYVNLTAGMRSDYVRDMATTRPPLLGDVERLRRAASSPLLISHGFRDAEMMEAALASGADLVGMARGVIADPDLPRKILSGRRREVRPCVACDEDCRAFDPTLLCTVNPDLAAPGDAQRRAAPLFRGAVPPAPRRVAIVGAGPAGLEAALTVQRTCDAAVVVFEAGARIGGTIATVATAPNRSGWQRIVDFYGRNLDPQRVQLRLGAAPEATELEAADVVIIATGAQEHLPEGVDGTGAVRTVTEAIDAGPAALHGVSHLVVVDDGFGWWPAVNALELAVAAAVPEVTIVTPGTAFATSLPGESRVALLKRLRGTVRLGMRPLTTLRTVGDGSLSLRSVAAQSDEDLAADAVIVVGERRPRDWSAFELSHLPLVVAGDAVAPRRVAHAIAEGRASGLRAAGRPVTVQAN